ncbi:MAG: hypothetical protein IPM18_10255 [Phycisphaerales bacterium]|nr:hypothetical protein [Phycisphaerales bacterium]
MEPAGWIVMLTSITFVVALVGFCYYRVLTAPAPDGLPNPFHPNEDSDKD